ncbi:antitoxin family protein [bacterium]|nr:antitoxin family protein [bacterium]MBU1614944.1 antitoxin family protein [bacterium]
MNETITAIYENGVLRPLNGLDLSEHEQVRIRIEPQEDINIAPRFSQRVEDFIKKYRPALEELAKR